MQSPGGQPTLCVAWCLIWWFASSEHVSSYMTPNVLSETRCHKTTQTHTHSNDCFVYIFRRGWTKWLYWQARTRIAKWTAAPFNNMECWWGMHVLKYIGTFQNNIAMEEKFADINIATLMCIAVLYRCHESICLLLSYTMEISTSWLDIHCSQDLKEYSSFLYHTQSNHCHIYFFRGGWTRWLYWQTRYGVTRIATGQQHLSAMWYSDQFFILYMYILNNKYYIN